MSIQGATLGALGVSGDWMWGGSGNSCADRMELCTLLMELDGCVTRGCIPSLSLSWDLPELLLPCFQCGGAKQLHLKEGHSLTACGHPSPSLCLHCRGQQVSLSAGTARCREQIPEGHKPGSSLRQGCAVAAGMARSAPALHSLQGPVGTL